MRYTRDNIIQLIMSTVKECSQSKDLQHINKDTLYNGLHSLLGTLERKSVLTPELSKPINCKIEHMSNKYTNKLITQSI